MAKTTRYNSDSRPGLALVEEDFHDEFDDSAPPYPAAANAREAEVRPKARATRKAPFVPEEEVEGEDPFLRVRRRVPVRRGPLPAWAKGRWGTILLISLVLLFIGSVLFVVFSVRHFLDHDSRFLIDSSASIQTMGNSELSRTDLLSVFGSDIGRNIFFVPLGVRAAQLEDIPWVRHATVMRILPDQLRVSVVERTPVAFLRVGSNISLIDNEGVVLSMSPELIAKHHFNFPVITGIDPAIPLAMRAQRIQLYQRFIAALDTGGKHVSDQVSEIDLADPEDVRATFSYNGHELLLHFGYTHFATRYHTYLTHIQAWEQQYPNLASIDLRYDDQAVLRMATPNAPAPSITDGAKTSPAVTRPAHHAASHHHVVRHVRHTQHSRRRAR